MRVHMSPALSGLLIFVEKQVQRQAMSNFDARPSYCVVSGGIDPITKTINRQAHGLIIKPISLARLISLQFKLSDPTSFVHARY